MFLNSEDRTKGSARLRTQQLPGQARLAGAFRGVYRLGGALLLAVVLLALPVTLPAQDTDNTTSEEIRVVVTADRILTDIASTGAAVSVITAEEIRKSGAAGVVEVLESHPGVSFTSTSTDAQATVDMRGFGEGSGNRVLVLVDGRRQNNPDLSGINWLGIPVDSIERIEILRGGAGALYGNNALGGVINIITKAAVAPFSVTASGSLGSFNETGSRLGISIAEEAARLRGSVEHYSTDGHRDRSAYEARNITLRSDFDLLPSVTLGLQGHYGDIFYEMPGGLTEDEFKDDPTQATNPGDEAREEQIDLGIDLEWAPASLIRLELPASYAARLVETDTASFSSYTDRDLHTFSASPAVIMDWDAGAVPVRSRLGVDWSTAEQKIRSYTSADRDDKNYVAILGHHTLGTALSSTAYVTEELDLGGTIRYDRSTFTAEKESSDIDEQKTHQAVVFDLEAVYRPVEIAKLYITGGTLFRYPALDEQASVQGFGDQFEDDLDPERGVTAEVGGGIYLGRLLQMDLGAWWLAMEDEIAYVYDEVTFQGANENIGKTSRIGTDFHITSEPVDFLRLSGGYSYVRATFANGDNKGNEVPLVPNHAVDGEAALRPGAGLGMEFGPAVTWRSASYQGGDDANDQDRIPAYLLTDIFLRFRPAGEDLSITAELKNIFDVQYAPLQFYSSFSGATAYYPAPGRTFRVAASYRY
jgi:iron complex outermembrane recepter protein